MSSLLHNKMAHKHGYRHLLLISSSIIFLESMTATFECIKHIEYSLYSEIIHCKPSLSIGTVQQPVPCVWEIGRIGLVVTVVATVIVMV